MAALGRFISRFGDKAMPFFKIMKRSGPFKWTPEAVVALEELKRYLVSPPILVAPQPREPLRLYLAATPQTASAPSWRNEKDRSQAEKGRHRPRKHCAARKPL